MKIINYEDLIFHTDENCGKGSFGNIKKCEFDGMTFAYKEFTDMDYLVGKKRKIDLLSNIDEPKLYVPKYWVRKDGHINQYLTGFLEGHDLDIASEENYSIKFSILKKVKEQIIKMHEYGLIHSDLIGSNIMYNENDIGIIDFDNASYGKYKTKLTHSNDLTQEFMKRYGITKELDIFIFNLVTFEIMNDIDSLYLTREQVYIKEYGVFDNPDSRKICDSFFLNDNVPNKDFLIDTIEDTISL